MISHAMLYTVAVGVPIGVAAGIGARFLRGHGRPERWVWVMAVLLAFVVPMVMVLSRGTAPQTASTTTPAPEPSGAATFVAGAPLPPAEGAPAAGLELDTLLLGIWLVGSLLLAGRWLTSTARLARMGAAWRRASLDGIPVIFTERMGPAVAGTLRPEILVPSWVASLPPEERRLVLHHEREHVRAGDPWLVALGRFSRILTPWNPVVWSLTSALGRGLELDCDRRVLRRHPDVARYGATLLMMSARTSGQLLAAAAFAESDVPLRRRILAMTTPPRTLSAVGLLGVLAIGIVLLTGALRVPVPEVAWALPLQVRAGVEAASPADALPPSRIIADPGRRWMGFFLESREIETREIAPANRWFPLSSDGRNGFFPVPYFPGASWGVVSPLPPEVELRQLTRIPRILNAGEILRAIGEAYPPRLRERGLGGTVGVQFLVEPAGVVVERRVGQISAYRDLDEAALAVARVYRFSGAELDGRPVPVWVSHAIDFRVD